MNILFLTLWYPHRYDAMEGLFVRKHAEAVARLAEVCVLYIHEDEHITQTEIVEQTTGALKEIIVYYPKQRKSVANLYHYFRAATIGFRQVKQVWGMPDVTHANVFLKPALLAYRLYRKYHIPYVVTEHWSGYMPTNGSYARLNIIHRCLTRYTAKKAAFVLPVSAALQQYMQAHGIQSNYQIVNNVVDDFFYRPISKEGHKGKKRILHISCFDEAAKNLQGMLRAARQVTNERQDFELVIVGTGVDFSATVAYADSLHFPQGILHFVGEQTPQEVCKWLQQSQFMLMFSNYESASVVIAEALATGTPIVSSAVGEIPRMMGKDAGILVAAKDENGLQHAISYMLDHYQDYDTQAIRDRGQQYSYAAVAEQLLSIYHQAITYIRE